MTSCEKLSVSKDETVYRFVLEPRFAALKHFQSSRLFQNQTVPDIVAAVFKHHGFSGVDYRFQKSRSYSVREYVTQYLESDFDFINRLCEKAAASRCRPIRAKWKCRHRMTSCS
ncbi:contractile injection system protein, VgrG/Pvc8 family [Neisseria sicca]|uniref:contractile injection system protein, VgrG/Pvc8 family n=1 Tax=Neisseria sicca TaxID=490 RepID=UPI0015E0A92B|nr:contractile injection system protein, VgrG/Pvc8 family [Neisseria sicca]